MKLKNVSARPYGIAGKLYAPLQEFELTDEVQIASIQSFIESGDFKLLDKVVEAEPAKRGRPAKVSEAE